MRTRQKRKLRNSKSHEADLGFRSVRICLSESMFVAAVPWLRPLSLKHGDKDLLFPNPPVYMVTSVSNLKSKSLPFHRAGVGNSI